MKKKYSGKLKIAARQNVKEREYWSQVISDDFEKSHFSYDYNALNGPPVFNSCSFSLPKEVAEKIRGFSNKNDYNLHMILSSSVAALLYKYTNRAVAVTGTAVYKQENIDDLINKILMIKCSIKEGSTFKELLLQTRESLIKANENQNYPLEFIFDELEINESENDNFPLYDVAVLLNSIHDSDYIEDIHNNINFIFTSNDDEISCELHYSSRYKESTILQIIKHYKELVSQLSLNIDVKLEELNLLDDEEREKVLVEFNDNKVDYGKDLSIIEMIEGFVKTTPDKKAVVLGEESITYKELDERANQLANYLINEKSVKKGDPVAILMDRRIEQIISIVGILKVGASYLPVDIAFPEERVKNMINDSEAKIIISEKKYIKSLNRLQWDCECLNSFICLDSDDVYNEKEVEKNELGGKRLWEYVGEKATDEISGGGWVSSYTGEDISKLEMDEYGDNILKKLTPHLHKEMRVLEIGCASGITMFRIAPQVAFYYGCDISSVIIEKDREIIENEGIKNIALACMPADGISEIEEENFDLVIINSVIQCFDGHNYLRRVLDMALEKMSDKGLLFLGDLMDQDLKDSLVDDMIAFKKANYGKNYTTKTDWGSELFISRSFLEDYMIECDQISGADFSKKIYTVENELTKFRYDAMLTIDKKKGCQREAKHRYQDDLRALSKYDYNKPSVELSPEDDVYIMYTSGTTGMPKGSVINNYNISRVVRNTKYAGFTENDVVLQLSNYAFDGSTFNIYGALLNGGTLVLIKREDSASVDNIGRIIKEQGITSLFLTTALFNTVVDVNIDYFKPLRKILIGGEKASVEHCKKALKELGKGVVVNGYGPTETTVFSNCCIIDEIDEKTSAIPIGKPIENVNIYILDKKMNPVPIGVAGEIYIGGDGVSKGYLKREELTKEKFINSPFIKGDRLYKTGDLAKWQLDGNVDFLGRADHQVKIRGFRVELGEIEEKIKRQGRINDVLVTMHTNESTNDKYLCAYIVAKEEIDTGLLKEDLLLDLPDFMIPAYFIQMEKFPLTSNGKVNRRALPLPDVNLSDNYVAPTDDIEKRLVSIWAEILNMNESVIGIKHNFFELGGHSLKGTLLSSMLRKEFEVEYPLREIFARPTISECADYIRGAETSGYQEIVRVEERAHYPLSSAQKRLFFLNRFDSESLAYNMNGVLKVVGNFDKDHFEKTIKKLIERHEVLRTTFDIVDNEPVQIIHDKVDFKIIEHTIDNPDYSQKDIEEILEQFVRPYDLSNAPLLRIELIKLPENEYLLLFDMHHIISDGTTMDIFVSEMFMLYNEEELEPLNIQYKDFANWQNEFLKSEQLTKQIDYWKDVFKGEIPVINLPEDYKRPEVFDFQGDVYGFQLEKEDLDKLKELTLKEDATLYMSLLATFNIALKLYSNQDDIITGTVIAGRRHHIGLQKIMGMFVNTLAMRNFPKNEKSFINFLNEVKENCLSAFENQDVQFEELIEMFDVKRDTSRNPLFDIGFTLQNAQDEEKVEKASKDTDIDFAPYDYEEYKSTTFDIDIDAYEIEDVVHFNVSYCTSIYKKSTIKRICDHWINIIRAVCANPDSLIGEIEVLSKEEREQILKVFNTSEYNFNEDKSYIKYFEENAESNPDKIAAVHNGKELTYKELNETANRAAHFLINKGVKEGEIVALYFSRGLEMLTAMLAVMKAGAAFIAIDVDFPKERIKGILNDCKAITLLTEPEWIDDVHEIQDSLAALENILCIEGVEQIEELLPDSPTGNPEVTIKGDNLAYLIFTSGTTGKPKGAMIHYNGLLNHLIVNRDFLKLTKEDRFAQTASTGFDISIWQFLIMPLVGGTVEIIDKELILDPKRLIELVNKSGLTILQLVPSLIRELLKVIDEERKAQMAGLRWLIPTGEALPVHLATLWYETFPELPLVNAYGPAETSDDVTLHIVDKEGPVQNRAIPIGKPLPNFHVYIIDESNRLCPIGVPGEITVAGVGVGKGYLNDEEKTAASFIANPFIAEIDNGDKYPIVYKTGDIGYYRADGILEILGRRDHQVKLRGSRIELGEIEYQLALHEEVTEAVVILRKDSRRGDYLQAFYVSEEEIESGDLKLYLADRVPGYMIPSYFNRLDAIPLTANGKTDRAALEAIELNQSSVEEYIEPGNNIEAAIAAVWAEVLQLDRVSTQDNFFDVGGHSLALIGVQSRLEEALGQNIAIATMFRFPTVSGLAQYLSDGGMSDIISDEEMEENVNIMEETFARMGEDE